MFGRIFGLDGRESYRKLRLELLCCAHRLSRGTAPHEREYPRRTARSGDRTHRATDGHLGSAARHCELAARLAAHLRRHPRQRHTSLSSRYRQLRLSEESGLRRVAMRGDPLLVNQGWSSFPVLVENGGFLGRIATSRLPTHIPDFTTLEDDPRDDLWIVTGNAGFRTGLFVPLLKDNETVGIIALGRKQVQPFTDNQISLFRDFAAQATIALESTRRE